MNPWFIAVGVLLTACASARGDGAGSADDPLDEDGAASPDGGSTARIDSGPGGGASSPDPSGAMTCTKMDLLFVIDDSASMAQEQDNLASNFPAFIAVLDDYGANSGTPLDYRVGVTTTGRDMTVMTPIGSQVANGANGALRTGNGCGLQRPWLERGDPDVASSFACAARVGTSGPPVEMPLLAVELALTQRVADGSNAGFLREDALLALVFLTDEDDCSRDEPVLTFDSEMCSEANLPPLDHYLALLDQAKGGRERWATAIIAGTGPGPCESPLGVANEAVRLRSFADAAGPNAAVSSICAGDLSSALDAALDTFDLACQNFPPIE